MSMSRADYELIARCFAAARRHHLAIFDTHSAAAIDNLSETLAHAIANATPSFDPAIFLSVAQSRSHLPARNARRDRGGDPRLAGSPPSPTRPSSLPRHSPPA